MPKYIPILFSLSFPLSSFSWAIATTTRISTLYATHYTGTIYSLSLTHNDNGGYSLSQTSSLQGSCGSMPSWLTFDASERVLYCSDEAGSSTSFSSSTSSGSGQGSLSAFEVNDEDGVLKKEIARTGTVGGGVSSVLYGGDGRKYLGVAHYQGSALSTFSLPLTPHKPALQIFNYTLPEGPGHNPSRQEAPHPHQVFLDPTRSFLLSPDLGADVVRVFAIDKQSGRLDACPDFRVARGRGPRHGVFWSSGLGGENQHQHQHHLHSDKRQVGQGRGQGKGHGHGHGQETMLYIVNELDNTLTAFTVDYNTPSSSSSSLSCPIFTEKQSITPYPDGNIPNGASVSEIQVSNNFIYVSIRSDHGFQSNDSIATLTANPQNGTLAFQDLTSAYGTVPRTFVINKAGDLVAIGNQASSNVVIVRRDPRTGRLGDEVASLQVGEAGRVGYSEGLSSVVWGE